MTLQLERYKISVDEYYKMAEVGILKPTDRVELIEGEIITMSPIKSSHAGMVNRLTKLIFRSMSENEFSVCIQNPIRIDDNSEPEPDLVIAKYRKDDYEKVHPIPEDVLLVIEVADSTLLKDRKIKLPLYAQAGIAEYWIVDVKKKQIEQYLNPKGKRFLSNKIIKKSGKISCQSTPLVLKGRDIFI